MINQLVRSRLANLFLTTCICLTLSACGGGGSGSNASTNAPPPTPPPSTVATVEVTPSNISFTALGESLSLTAIAKDSTGNVISGLAITWSSSDTGVATADASGLVTAVTNGSAEITATISGTSGIASLTVSQVVQSIEVLPNSVELMSVGAEAQVVAIARDANGNEIPSVNTSPQNFQWTSSDGATASVTDGQITAIGFGDATISATAEGVSDGVSIRIVFPGDFDLLPTDWAMPVGEFVRFMHKLGGDQTAAVEWTVNGIPDGNSEVGTIQPGGGYTAPTTIPVINPVTVRATLVANPSISAESLVTITLAGGAGGPNWWVWTPRVAVPGGTDPLMLEVGFTGYPSLSLGRDDGVQLEPVALESGVYGWQLLPAEVLTDYFEGFLENFVGWLDCIACSPGSPPRQPILVNVKDSTVPSATVASLANDVQASSHLINMSTDRPPSDLIEDLNNLTIYHQNLYQYFSDNFDLITLIGQVDFVAVASFVTARNDVIGTGKNITDDTARYGSQGRLIGTITVKQNYDGIGRVLLHEIGHAWIAFLDKPPILTRNYRSHWPHYSSLGNGIIAGDRLVQYTQVSQDIFELVCLPNDFSQPVWEFTDIELYLMGLVPPSEVQPHVVLQDQQGPWFCGDQASVDVVTIDDIVADYGLRVPDSTQSQKDFTMATVLLSKGRLLTQDEMAFYNYLAERVESRVPVPQKGDERLVNPFYLATGMRATISTRVLP